MIPAEAVEAAAAHMHDEEGYFETFEDAPDFRKEHFRGKAVGILEAAAPHMLEDKRGAGDYLPGWDDRKTLAGIWQEHAMLPVEGLSDGVYSALIAVATWGYQQRKDEDL